MTFSILIVPDHDHSLEFVAWAVSGSLPEGLRILFDQVERWPTDLGPRPAVAGVVALTAELWC